MAFRPHAVRGERRGDSGGFQAGAVTLPAMQPSRYMKRKRGDGRGTRRSSEANKSFYWQNTPAWTGRRLAIVMVGTARNERAAREHEAGRRPQDGIILFELAPRARLRLQERAAAAAARRTRRRQRPRGCTAWNAREERRAAPARMTACHRRELVRGEGGVPDMPPRAPRCACDTCTALERSGCAPPHVLRALVPLGCARCSGLRVSRCCRTRCATSVPAVFRRPAAAMGSSEGLTGPLTDFECTAIAAPPQIGQLNPPYRLLCGPGPGNAHPRVHAASMLCVFLGSGGRVCVCRGALVARSRRCADCSCPFHVVCREPQ